MLDANPNLTVQQVRDMLRETAVDWGPTGQDVDYGWGRLNGYAAVKRAGNFSGGGGPAVPGHAYFSGTLANTGAKAEHSFTVTDTAYPVNVTLIMPGWTGSSSPDFDLYVFSPDGSELGRATGTSRQDQVTKRITRTGTYRIEVRAYAGSGPYFVDVSAGVSGASDQPPTVAIDQPPDGATVSGTAQVQVRAGDDAGISKVELAVDGGTYTDITGGFDGSHYLYAWDTTTVANGAHTLTARATDTAGQQTTASSAVTVSNETQPPPDRQQKVVRTGRVTGGSRDANLEFNVHETGFVDLTLAWPTRADLDFYVYAPDGTYIGRAYTLNNPEKLRVDTVRFGTGTYTVRVNLYSGADSDFTLTAEGYRREESAGSVTPSARDAVHSRTINFAGRGRVVLRWSHPSDLDFYVYDPSGRERGRAFTLYNPEQLDVTLDTTGAWSVRVNLYSGPGGTYTLQLFVPEAVLS